MAEPTEPDAAESWCTVATVASLTGKTVTAVDRNLAAFAIELTTGLIESVKRTDMTRRDAYWLQQAVAFQAAWLSETPDYLERNDVSSASQDGQSVTLKPDALVLAPLARRAIKRLSWRGTRSIRPIAVDERGRIRLTADYVPLEAHDDLQVWRPL